MKAILGTVKIDGEKVRRLMILEERYCEKCNDLFQPKTQKSKVCEKCLKEKQKQKQKRKIDRYLNPNDRYRDKSRHGGKRLKLLSTECGLTCSMCGKEGNRFEIVTHHIMHNPSKHKDQTQLCRSCHAMEHYDESTFGEQKRIINENYRSITKEQVSKALDENKEVEGACVALGIARCSLYKLRKKYGFAMTRPQKVNLSEADLLSVAHMEQKEQMKVLGVSRRTICKYRKKFGLT